MSDITIKNGEAKTLTFTITRDGSVLDLTNASLDFGVKANYSDTSFLISKTTTDFDKTNATTGEVGVTLTTTDTDEDTITYGTYLAELRVIITAGTDVDISANINFIVERSLYG